jgi:peptidoglycan/LPS O-acetylase OafA/YrhL
LLKSRGVGLIIKTSAQADLARSNLRKLTTSESLALDVIRVGAAIIVVIGHITQPYFSIGLPNLIYFGRSAVVFFFVLSGFVIRYVTVRRPETMGEFIRDRASRIYSVALPALIITIVADLMSQKFNPGFYSTWNLTQAQKIVGVVSNLIWTAQLWTRSDTPFSNSPFWSLNYEVIYYVIYACVFYLSGSKRWIWTAVIAFIAGPKILLLLPAWLLGCFAHDIYQKWDGSKKFTIYLDWGCVAIVLGALAFAVDHKLVNEVMKFYDFFYLAGRSLKLGRTSGVIDFYGESIVFAILMLRVLMAVRYVRICADGTFARLARLLAEGTFAIYLIHFPLLVLVAATTSYNPASLWQKGLTLCVVIAFGVLVGQFCKIFKIKLRTVIFYSSQIS